MPHCWKSHVTAQFIFQTWADAFRGTPDLKDVEKVYQDLKSKGIEFPMTDLDHLAPIHTPARVGIDSQRQEFSTSSHVCL